MRVTVVAAVLTAVALLFTALPPPVACAAAAASSSSHRHVSPVTLYGRGGRGVMAAETLNYDGVVMCVFEIADRSYDGRLNHIELDQALVRYLTAYERLASGLSAAQLITQCDADADGLLSTDDLSAERHCLRTAQLEALTRYLCDRAKHRDYAYDQYKAQADALRAAIAQGGARGLISQGVQAVRDMAAPHAGRHARLDSPNTQQQHDLIGARLQWQFIIAAIFVVFIVLIVAAVALVAA